MAWQQLGRCAWSVNDVTFAFADGLYRFYLRAPILPDVLLEIRERRDYPFLPTGGYLGVKDVFIVALHSYRVTSLLSRVHSLQGEISPGATRDKLVQNCPCVRTSPTQIRRRQNVVKGKRVSRLR